jgi:hypothetical protein
LTDRGDRVVAHRSRSADSFSYISDLGGGGLDFVMEETFHILFFGSDAVGAEFSSCFVSLRGIGLQ